ncbi:hypothetical protein Pmani_014319 [Petrolisthes manimaculis]|uniref:Uncharacterized protein n=1 Tax=Petrolisthes manimaculis TaxID=1843537 RepID=A0AAE1PUK9_9EUCA|nr:hypothetical protein Pmani_014319 [Petrolisthes manimaculis]
MGAREECQPLHPDRSKHCHTHQPDFAQTFTAVPIRASSLLLYMSIPSYSASTLLLLPPTPPHFYSVSILLCLTPTLPHSHLTSLPPYLTPTLPHSHPTSLPPHLTPTPPHSHLTSLPPYLTTDINPAHTSPSTQFLKSK